MIELSNLGHREGWEAFRAWALARPAGQIRELHVLANCGLYLQLETNLTNPDLEELLADALEELAEYPADRPVPNPGCPCNWRAASLAPRHHSLERAGYLIHVGSY